jgi:predicted nucleic acid-binding protein
VEVVCAQVLTEYMNVCLRKFKKSKFETIQYADFIISKSHFSGTSITTIQSAFSLVKKYDFQLFDAIIVASSLEAGCTTLYTEDMQHDLVIEQQLTIKNPFL